MKLFTIKFFEGSDDSSSSEDSYYSSDELCWSYYLEIVFSYFFKIFVSCETSYFFFYKVDYLLASDRSKEDELLSLLEPDYF